MDDRFTCAFILRKSRNKRKTESDVYARITVNGKRSVMSINRKVDPRKWNKIAGRALGKSEACDGLNEFIDIIRNKFNKIHSQLKDDEKLITASTMIREFNSGGKPTRMVLEVFKEHNEQCDQLIDKDISKSTAKRYWTCYGHVKQFINEVLKEDDYRFKDVNYDFVTKFEHFLKTVRNCNHNSALKYVNNFKKIVRIAIANKWLEDNPFYNYKVQFEEVDREYLTADEIKTLWEKDLHFDRLILVRDMFIFSC